MRWHALGETWPPRGSGVTFSDTRAIHDARVDYYILLHLDRFDTRKETSDRSTRNAPQKVKESTRTLTENFTHKTEKNHKNIAPSLNISTKRLTVADSCACNLIYLYLLLKQLNKGIFQNTCSPLSQFAVVSQLLLTKLPVLRLRTP